MLENWLIEGRELASEMNKRTLKNLFKESVHVPEGISGAYSGQHGYMPNNRQHLHVNRAKELCLFCYIVS